MNFHIGQKVVCVDALFIDARWYRCEQQPVKGVVYTIRGFTPPNYFSTDEPDVPALYLEEIVNSPVEWTTGVFELGFSRRRFRPLVTRKTEIAIFKRMLAPKELEPV